MFCIFVSFSGRKLKFYHKKKKQKKNKKKKKQHCKILTKKVSFPLLQYKQILKIG